MRVTKRRRNDLIVIAILTLGVMAGVLLIKQNQEIRERAQWLETYKYILCHKTGDPDNPWKEIKVTQEELQEYLAHGDIIGECPEDMYAPRPTTYYRTPSSTPTSTPIPTSTPSPTPFVASPTPSPEEEEERKVEEVPVEPTSVGFSVSFQAINQKCSNKAVELTFQSEQGEEKVYRDVGVESDLDGRYSGLIEDLPLGKYDIFIKTPYYLSVTVLDVDINSSGSTANWTDKPFWAGDFNGDGKITLNDIALFLGIYQEEETMVSADNERFDINCDGLITIGDLDVVLGNYKELEVSRD